MGIGSGRFGSDAGFNPVRKNKLPFRSHKAGKPENAFTHSFPLLQNTRKPPWNENPAESY